MTRMGGLYDRLVVNRENKWFDVSEATNPTQTGATILEMNVPLPQGTGESARIGRKIFVKSIYLRWRFNPAVASETQRVRIAIILDKQCNGAVATYGDVFQAGGSIWQRPRNLSNAARFQILKLWDVEIGATGGGPRADSPFTTDRFYHVARNFHYFKKCNIPITYNGTTGVVTEVCCNNLLILGSSNLDTGGFAYTCRIRFTD